MRSALWTIIGVFLLMYLCVTNQGRADDNIAVQGPASGVSFASNYQGSRTVFLSGGDARALFDRYIAAADDKTVPLNFDKLTVVFVEKGREVRLKARQDVKLSLNDLLRGKRMSDKWRSVLKNRTADEVPGRTEFAARDDADLAWAETRPAPPPTEPCSEWFRQLAMRLSRLKPEEKPALTADVRTAEGNCGEDYRFTYLLAELYTFPGDTDAERAHHEAFKALGKAALKAIETRHAKAMLNSLRQDVTTVFNPLSDHPQWACLLQALGDGGLTIDKDLAVHLSACASCKPCGRKPLTGPQ